jgi:hypothetical protein
VPLTSQDLGVSKAPRYLRRATTKHRATIQANYSDEPPLFATNCSSSAINLSLLCLAEQSLFGPAALGARPNALQALSTSALISALALSPYSVCPDSARARSLCSTAAGSWRYCSTIGEGSSEPGPLQALAGRSVGHKPHIGRLDVQHTSGILRSDWRTCCLLTRLESGEECSSYGFGALWPCAVNNRDVCTNELRYVRRSQHYLGGPRLDYLSRNYCRQR